MTILFSSIFLKLLQADSNWRKNRSLILLTLSFIDILSTLNEISIWQNLSRQNVDNFQLRKIPRVLKIDHCNPIYLQTSIKNSSPHFFTSFTSHKKVDFFSNEFLFILKLLRNWKDFFRWKVSLLFLLAQKKNRKISCVRESSNPRTKEI